MELSVQHQCRPQVKDAGIEPWQLPTPTLAIPGSPEKLAVMRARLLAGEQLHHPFDRKACPQPASFHLHHVWANRDAVEPSDCLPIATRLIEADPSRQHTR